MADDNQATEVHMKPRVLLDRGMDLFEQGDYQAARQDFRRIVASDASEDIQAKARAMLRKLGVDPVEITVGVAVLLLIVLVFVFFGWRH